MDYQEELETFKEKLQRENLDTYMTIEQKTEQKGSPKENLLEYLDCLEGVYQEMREHSNDLPNDIQNGGLVHMILSQSFMKEVSRLKRKVLEEDQE